MIDQIFSKTVAKFALALVFCFAINHFKIASSQEVVITLKDGRQYEGRLSGFTEYTLTASNALVPGTTFPIAMVDDGLRRVFFNAYRRAAREVPSEKTIESFEIWQDPIFKSNRGYGVGPVLGKTRFDEYGRRIITLLTADGRESYVQGITEITPDYVRVVGLQTKGKNRYFDMRYATTSVPRDVIVKLLRRHISNPNQALERERLIKFFAAAEMYEEADQELKAMESKFPGLKKENEERRKELVIRIHRRALNEIRFRFEAGQAKLAKEMWDSYPDKRSMPGEIAAEFDDLNNQIKNQAQQIEAVKKAIVSVVDAGLNSPDIDVAQKKTLLNYKTEIENNLNEANVERFTTFFRFADDGTITLEQKLAYAISSWFVGSAKAVENFAVAHTFPLTRDLVREYLTTADAARRAAILGELEQIESGTPEYIALILGNLTPLLPPEKPEEPGKAYRFTVEIAAPENKKETVEYFVQLPPEYNPHKKYPCVVTLPTLGFDAEKQLVWWYGQYMKKLDIHSGPASRHGYIVISPKWYSDKQSNYEYSVREHDAVLSSVRDAFRRFSIDTDKVFLSGHFKGGDAAFDIGLSHPDLWAGVIPVSAKPDKYCIHYFETAKNDVLPFYVVIGSKDFGVRTNDEKDPFMMTLDRWLRRTSAKVDCTVVEYQGRGGEDFFEEVHDIFNWMKLKKRFWVPPNFEARSLRKTDNFFWNLEVGNIPANAHVPPILYSTKKRDTFKMSVEQKANNTFVVKPQRTGSNFTLWLGPEFVDFSKNVTIQGRGNDYDESVKPSRKVILDDARTRVDLQHPFWAKLFCSRSKWVNPEEQSEGK